MKVCTKCKVEKEISEFQIRPERSTGYYAQCKICVNAKKKEWRESNPGKTSEYSKKYRDTHLEQRRQEDRDYAKNNRQKKTDAFRAWRHKNPEKAKTTADRHKHKSVEWAKQNKDRIRASQKAWRKRNKDKINANTSLYRSSVINATPPWLNKEHKRQIANFYRIARHMSDFHEEQFHVDHIEPLNGKNSSGLHLPWNLQVLPALENVKKSNKLITT